MGGSRVGAPQAACATCEMDGTHGVVIAPKPCACICCWGSVAAESHWLYL